MSYRRAFQEVFRRSFINPKHCRRGFRDSPVMRDIGRGRWLYPRWGPGSGWGPGCGSRGGPGSGWGPGFGSRWGVGPWKDHNSESPFNFMKYASRIMEEMQHDFEKAGFPFRHTTPPPWCTRSGVISAESALPEVKFTDKEFRVKVDVQHYTPEEIDVKIGENMVKIGAKHESKHDDYGMVSREFSREFTIPEAVNQDTLECQISEDGFLTVYGTIKEGEAPKSRTLNIERETPSEKKDE